MQKKSCHLTPLRNGDASDAGAYQQDAVQNGIQQITSRIFGTVTENSAGPAAVVGNATRVTSTEATSYNVASGNIRTGVHVWTVHQRNAEETRPCNVSLVCGVYLGRTA